MRLLERADERQHRVDSALVGADDDAADADVAQVGDGGGRLVNEPQQPRGVVEQHLAGVGQRPVARRAIDQPLPGAVFEPADRLADRGLRPAELVGRAREAPLGGDNGEHAEVFERHVQIRAASGMSVNKIIHY